MEGEQRHQTLEEGSHHGEKTGIYDAEEWFKRVADSELEKEYAEEPFMEVSDTARLNTELDAYAARDKAHSVAREAEPIVSMPKNGKKQQSQKPPKKQGFFARLFGGLFRKKS